MSLQKAVLRHFLREKISHGQTVHFGPHSVRHIRKAEHLRIKNKWLKFDFRHPMERQIFGDEVGLDPALILAMCLILFLPHQLVAKKSQHDWAVSRGCVIPNAEVRGCVTFADLS